MAKRGKFNKKGFTLSEALIVVAVISILLALAVPNVIRYSRELKLAELDDSAKAIYMAAQNRLNALIASGEDVEKSVGGSHLNVTNPGGDVSTGSERTYVSTSAGSSVGEGNCAYLVPAGSIESQLAGNYYVVEYNALTGVVFAVWYWEDADDFEYADDIQSRLVVDDPDYDPAKDPATRDYRLAHGMMVGYYGGTDVEREKLQQMPKMNVTLTNAEELVLDICIPDGMGMHVADCLIDVEINGVPILEKCGLEPGEAYHGRVVLDTLKSGYYSQTVQSDELEWTIGDSYLNWYNKCVQQNSKMPLPGRDIVITVTLSHAKNEYLPRVVKVAGNSLFAGLDSANEAVTIKYGRHLQNLDPATSGFNAIEDADKNAQTVATSAMLIGNIDFKATEYMDYTTNPAHSEVLPAIQSWESTYGYETLPFTPIYNDLLTDFNGNKYTIRNLNIDGGMFGASGLFSYADAGRTFENINIVNPRTNSTSLYAGALIATAGKVTIDNCHVYLDDEGMKDSRDGKRFIQGIECGGLVGLATYTEIKNSSASVPVNSSSEGIETGDLGDLEVIAGGLVGTCIDGGEIDNCYAAGYIHSTGFAGGLVGNSEANVRNSYSAGEIDCENAAIIGGLIAKVSSPGTGSLDIKNVYAAVRFTNITKKGTGVEINGIFAGNTTHKFIKQNGLEYADEGCGVGTANKLGITADDIWESPTYTAPTLPYKLIAETQRLDNYPYPRLKDNTAMNAHYGDWLEENNAALVYYEVRGGQYYINGKVVDAVMPTEPAKNTLYDNLAAGTGLNLVNQDGYGILLPGDDAILLPTVKIDGTEITLTPAEEITYDGGEYSLFILENPLKDNGFVSYYTPVKIGDYDYWYNPFFPCEVLTENDTRPADGPAAKEKVAGDPYDEGTVLIRSARHVANMELFVTASHDYNYEQLLNVDFKQYTEAYYDNGKSTNLDTVISLDAGHTYDGNNHTISNMTVNINSGDAGLFSSVLGEVSNITLVNMSVKGTDSAGTLAGVLAAGGNVSGCGSYASDAGAYDSHTVTASGNAGGLIGQMTGGSVTSSYAAVKVSGGTAGGFVGSASGGSIESSFSGGHTVGGIYTSDTNVTGTAKAGGFAGELTGATVSAPCYSTCSAKGPENSVGQFAGVGTTTHTGTFYAIGMTFNSSNTPTVPVDGELLTDPVASGGAVTALTYDNKWTNSMYPYLATGVAHHGDWPVRPTLQYHEEGTDVVTNDYYFLNDTPTYTPYAMKPAANVIGGITAAENDRLSWDVHNCAPGSTFYMTLYMNGYRAYFNPHFAETVLTDKPTDFTKPVDSNVFVNSARQLANISKYTTGAATVNGQGWTYAQGKNIDFTAYTGWVEFTAGKADTPLAPANLAGGQYLGQGNYISSLYSDGGLFATVNNNSTISDLTFKNSSAMSTTSENVGLLAGTITGSTISSVTVIDSTVSGTNAGALAGTVSGSVVENCGARIDRDSLTPEEVTELYLNKSVQGIKYVGGLIGYISNNSSVTDSYAAVKVYSNDIAGGFAGVISNSLIEDCYAGGHTEEGVYKETSINVTGGTAGGFVGSVSGEPKSNFLGICYSTCSVKGLVAEDPFVGNDEGINSTGSLFGTGALFGVGKTKEDYSTPVAADPTHVTTPHPYDHTLDGQAFPYASNLSEHYGDWSNNKLTFGVFYRDRCSIHGYGYYIKVWQLDENGEWPDEPIVIRQLCTEHNDDGVINEDAYGFFFAGGQPTYEGITSSGAASLDENSIKNYLNGLTTDHPEFDSTVLTDLKVYTVTGDAGGGETWTFTFGSADSLSVYVDRRFGAAFGDNSETNRYQIRNLDQLSNIRYLSGDYFNQTHDIPAGIFNPIPTFSGQYDGGGYLIRNITINITNNTAARAALFATTESATIQNVVLLGGRISINNTEDNTFVGGIVADGSGTISNCVVTADFSEAGASSVRGTRTYVGGIAGRFTGTIQHCQVVTSIDVRGSSIGAGTGDVGGIVGYLAGGSVSYCYSGGSITEESIFGIGNVSSGGIAGTNNGGSTSITYCYTYMTDADYAIVGSGGNGYGTCAYVNGIGYNNRNNGADQITPGNHQLLETYFHPGTAVETGNEYVGCTVLSYDGISYVHYGTPPWRN